MAQTNNSYIDSLKKEFVTMDSTQRKLFINAIKFDTQNYNTKKELRQLVSWCERNLLTIN